MRNKVAELTHILQEIEGAQRNMEAELKQFREDAMIVVGAFHEAWEREEIPRTPANVSANTHAVMLIRKVGKL